MRGLCSFQEDLDGNLFNMRDFFPSKQCSSLLGGTNSSFEPLSVVGDEGKVQSVISYLLSLLQGSSFYVNAKKESGENLFKYGESDNSEEELYHLALQNLEKEEEQCLTFSLNESGNLVSAGVDCQTRIKPLCLQVTPEHLDSVDDKCQECSPDVYQTKCGKWATLLLEDTVNGYKIEGADICVQPCGLEVFEDSEAYCQVAIFLFLVVERFKPIQILGN